MEIDIDIDIAMKMEMEIGGGWRMAEAERRTEEGGEGGEREG